jgi:hypothetical protein
LREGPARWVGPGNVSFSFIFFLLSFFFTIYFSFFLKYISFFPFSEENGFCACTNGYRSYLSPLCIPRDL